MTVEGAIARKYSNLFARERQLCMRTMAMDGSGEEKAQGSVTQHVFLICVPTSRQEERHTLDLYPRHTYSMICH